MKKNIFNSKRSYSDLFEEYLVIYHDTKLERSLIEHCGENEADAIAFQESLETSVAMPWMLSQ